jgi:hypothetical protein
MVMMMTLMVILMMVVLMMVRLDKEITRRVVRLRPTFKKFVNPNGTLIVRLNKALYGCIESAKLWYDNLCTTFQSMGFLPNPL